MTDSKKVRVRSYRFERYQWVLIVIWTMVVATSLGWNVVQFKHNILETARIEARTAYKKDIIYRRWNTGHKGVYVPVTEITQPNPYLTDIHERDITTQSGKRLTLMNPAYMTRQVHELAEEEYGVLGHITSLNPIRPENAPDPWETEALQAFERGEIEISSLKEMKGKEYMRLMRPLIVERDCLICHAAQGYQEGDIRGGISVSFPMAPLKAIAYMNVLTLAVGHILLWLMGLGGIVLGTWEVLSKSEKERKRAEETLRGSEERYRAIFEQATDSIVLVDAKTGELVEFNDKAHENLGYTREEFEKLMILDFEIIESPEDVTKHIEKILRDGADTFETKHKTKSGQIRDILVNSKAITIGGKDSIYGIWTDITERKHAEEELRLHSRLLTNMDEGVYLIRASDGIIVYTNPAFERIFGYDSGEMIGKHVSIVNAPTQRDPEEKAKEIIEFLKKTGKWEGEVNNIKKDGTSFWSYAIVSTFEHYEYGPVWISVHTDITERKRAEEALLRLKDELEIKVTERTEELQERVKELEHFHEVTVDRELRMEELRNKIEELEKKLEEKQKR